jgi:outer membrane lipoprotein LolB
MAGRISVTQEGHGDIFRLRWTHRPASDVYSLVSPVGTELARIERGPQGYVAWRPGQTPVAVSEFATLTQHLLGVALDERALVAWLHVRTGAAQSAGWWVTLEESQQVDGEEIARRLTAVRDGVTMKLVVDSYRAIAP